MTVMVDEADRGDIDPGRWPGNDASVELAMGLQLLRASSLTSTRLQLALARRDRRGAMTALDTLAAIDGEIEGLVGRLSAPDAAPPELAAIAAWLSEEKAATAAEKLNLACDARGPGLVSSGDRLAEAAGDADIVDQAANDDGGPVPVEPGSSRRWRALGLVAVMLAVVAVGLVLAFDLSGIAAAPSFAGLSRLLGG